MNYCYARVSTAEQHLDRQIVAFDPYKPYTLYQDKESGKDFNRPNYQKMKRKLKSGDTLFVLSLDRFGRNYDEIKKEWQQLTNKGVKIKIIDMPIIDTTTDNLTSKLISDIVIQLLSYVAQTEREMILKRLNAGIKVAKEKGVKFGRPRINLPSNFDEVATQYLNDEITNIEACEILDLSRGTFFRYLQERGFGAKRIYQPYKFKKDIKYEVKYLDKTKILTRKQVLEELGISTPTLRKYLNGSYTIINAMEIEIKEIQENDKRTM